MRQVLAAVRIRRRESSRKKSAEEIGAILTYGALHAFFAAYSQLQRSHESALSAIKAGVIRPYNLISLKRNYLTKTNISREYAPRHPPEYAISKERKKRGRGKRTRNAPELNVNARLNLPASKLNCSILSITHQ